MGRFTDALFGRRDTEPASRTLVGFTDGGLLPAGVSGTTAVGLSSVWRCLDILSNGVSQLEWSERRGNLELPPSHIVDRPQAARTRREWVSYQVAGMALYDVAYALKAGVGEDGLPLDLIPVNPTLVAPAVNVNDPLGILPALEYWVGATRVPADQLVIMRRSPTPGLDDATGGVIRLARVTFAAAMAAESYASRYWQAGGAPTTVLETDQRIPEPVAQATSDSWFNKRSRGPDYAPVLQAGLKARSFGADATAESAVEARREMVADVGRYFGVPTRILNAPTGDSETYSSTPAANMDLIRYTLQNYIGAIQDAISDLLPPGRRMVMDTKELTRDTLLNTAQAMATFTGGKSVIDVDEAREYLGYPPAERPDLLNPAPAPATVGGTNG